MELFSIRIRRTFQLVSTIFALTKELFESMRNMVVLNSLAFSYPLPVLMRVFYKALVIK